MDDACVACARPVSSSAWLTLSWGALHRCLTCATLNALPRPGARAQAALHDQPEYFEHPYFELRRDIDRAEERCRHVFARLAPHYRNGDFHTARHLDVGCDVGTLLAVGAARFGTVPFGVDVSQRSIAAAQSAGIEAFCGTLDALPTDVGPFDLVTAIDLIEHVPDPCGLLVDIRGRLARGGVCYIETPNPSSLVYGTGRWASGAIGALGHRLFPPEHIQYFSAKGLEALATRAGLRLRSLGRRTLAWRDLAVPAPVRAALTGLQFADQLLKTEILHWAILSAAR